MTDTATKQLLHCYETLLEAAEEYITYEHDGDPWSEDARAMGEMELDDIGEEGLALFKEVLRNFKENSNDNKHSIS